MRTPENESSIQLELIIGLAKNNTEEDWKEIDGQLLQVCNEPVFLNWARGNTDNKDSGLRDLAGSILEASDTDLTPADIDRLKALMEDESYPGFRAACALAKRASQKEISGSKKMIIEKLKKFTKDEGVSEIAEKYLFLFSE